MTFACPNNLESLSSEQNWYNNSVAFSSHYLSSEEKSLYYISTMLQM